jgi:predicted transposase/invertase (TIGR01784 family)
MRAIDNAHQQYLHDYATDIGSAHRKGLAEGEAKGKAEIAVNLKQMGLSSAEIAKATNLSIAEIERLS